MENNVVDEKQLKREMQAKTTSNPWLVGAMIFIIWPVGLYYMWKNSVYNLPVRIIISIVVVLLTLINVLGMMIGLSQQQ